MAGLISSKATTALQSALELLESDRAGITQQINAIRALLGPTEKMAGAEAPSEAKPTGRRKRRRLSAEARERIAAAQRKRWEAFRKQQ